MENIRKDEFLSRQPNYPELEESDIFYYNISNELYHLSAKSEIVKELPDALLRRMAVGVTGYLQDVVSDAGVWREFVNANRRLYGWSVPFHEMPEDYIDYELNREDVRFLVWYILTMSYEPARFKYPHDPMILDLADIWFDHLESTYDNAPAPTNYNLARGLELNDPDDSDAVFHLGQWLFLYCYLMTPAYSLTLDEIMGEPEMKKKDNFRVVRERLEQSMIEDPTGPLAFYIPEWLRLIVENKMPEVKKEPQGKIHPYYEKFTNATGGTTIKFFDTYESMNRFFIDSLGWEAATNHLPMMKESSDFVLMVDQHRGMLAARGVARCIAAPNNPYYDKEYAEQNAFRLLTERGLCPGDLLRRVIESGWLPDARFPETCDTQLVAENADFIARCYLQKYYRGD